MFESKNLHAEYTIRAAAAGKPVLCEKPMAINPQECEQMIAACLKADRKLMIAYRIQYEPDNRSVPAYVREQKFGRVGESGWIGMDPAFSYYNLRNELSQAQGKNEIRSAGTPVRLNVAGSGKYDQFRGSRPQS